MHALMDVVEALNKNQSFVPYRGSKLTHIMQDSLCKTNSSVLIVCLVRIIETFLFFTTSTLTRCVRILS